MHLAFDESSNRSPPTPATSERCTTSATSLPADVASNPARVSLPPGRCSEFTDVARSAEDASPRVVRWVRSTCLRNVSGRLRTVQTALPCPVRCGRCPVCKFSTRNLQRRSARLQKTRPNWFKCYWIHWPTTTTSHPSRFGMQCWPWRQSSTRKCDALVRCQSKPNRIAFRTAAASKLRVSEDAFQTHARLAHVSSLCVWPRTTPLTLADHARTAAY